MLFKTISASVYGIDAYPVEVEVDVGSAYMKDLNVVGLPDNAVKESRERIKSALHNCEFEFPYGQGVTSIWPPRICARRALASICPWRWAWWAAKDNSLARCWTR
jgi:magnesium chelatase family protein